jgi:hypothetical protein
MICAPGRACWSTRTISGRMTDGWPPAADGPSHAARRHRRG